MLVEYMKFMPCSSIIPHANADSSSIQVDRYGEFAVAPSSVGGNSSSEPKLLGRFRAGYFGPQSSLPWSLFMGG